MGAEQSSTRGASTAASDSSPKKTDYYQLLGVDRTATDDESVLFPLPLGTPVPQPLAVSL